MVKILYHLFDTSYASRHRTDYVELIAVVDTHVRIRRPNQNGITPPYLVCRSSR